MLFPSITTVTFCERAKFPPDDIGQQIAVPKALLSN
ncbi:hypothetical protein HAINFHK1212_1471, partial [Haemophilus influenzae HK1212]